MLLLHGFLGSGANLGTLARGLSRRQEGMSFWQVDLPGHGKSPAVSDEDDILDAARRVLDFIKTQGLGSDLVVLGHSLGGRIALAARQLDPAALSQLILLDIAPGPTSKLGVAQMAQHILSGPDEADRREDFVEALLESGVPDGMAKWMAMNVERIDGKFRWRIDRQALLQFHKNSSELDFWDEVKRDPTGLWSIRGGNSDYVSEDDVKHFAALGVPTDVIEGAGHFVHAEKPKELIELVSSRL